MITPAQLTKIWARKSEVSMSEERLRNTLERLTGKRSTRALTKKQAIRVIEVLEGESCVPVARDNKKVIPLVTQSQLNFIEKLRIAAGWTENDLLSFAKKQFKRNKMRGLSRFQAGTIIKILKGYSEKKRELA